MSVQDENRPRKRSDHMLQQLLAELRQIDHCPTLDPQPNPDHRRVWPLPPLDDPAYPAVSRVEPYARLANDPASRLHKPRAWT